MAKSYPNISGIIKKPKNTCATCKCGEIGKFIIIVQVDYFRGDDDYLWSCDEHKRDLEFLTSK